MNVLMFILQTRDLVPQIETGTPKSVMGWASFVFGLIACVILIWDRVIGKGKAEQKVTEKIDDLSEKLEDLEGRLEVFDGLGRSVSELVYEWRGIDGRNGLKSVLREQGQHLTEIQRRNNRLDAIREEDERRSGGQRRRLIDRELDNLLPEKREKDK